MNPHFFPRAAAIALALVLPAHADEGPLIVFKGEHLAAGEAPRAFHWEFDTGELGEAMGAMFATRLGTGKVVKGAPYAAQMVTETRQALADGNVISRRKTGAVYRDGEGRTRQETASEAAGEGPVYLSDPVAGSYVILTPRSKRAITVRPKALSFHRGTKEKQVVRLGGGEVRVEDGKVFVDGKETGAGRIEVVKGGKTIVVEDGKITIDGKDVSELGGERKVVVKRIPGPDGADREEIRVQVVRAPGAKDALAPLAPGRAHAGHGAWLAGLPGLQTLRFESTAKLGKGVTTSLGMKDFDGVKAEGKATTWTIPAGEIGNRDAITVMSETWYAPELQVTVYSRHNDPRTGESIYRLEAIRRGEPPADLFRVPEDYKVRGRAPKG